MDLRTRFLLRATAAALLLAVLPLPYGYYVFLRLLVCCAVLCAAFRMKGCVSRPYFVGLIIAGILFNPILSISFPKEVWIPIDLFGAFMFFKLTNGNVGEEPSVRELVCANCGGRLRVPHLKQTIKVTCSHCRCQFFQQTG